MLKLSAISTSYSRKSIFIKSSNTTKKYNSINVKIPNTKEC